MVFQKRIRICCYKLEKSIYLMCGIFGLINLNGERINREELKKSNNFLNHRGKDGDGYWTEGTIGLAHKRLAIIDLSTKASQPMSSENQRYIISYNGEIYNFKELRDQLESKGLVSIHQVIPK